MPASAAIPAAVMAMPSSAYMAAKRGEQIDKALAEAAVADIPVQIIEGDAGAALAAETAIADLVVLGRTGSGQRGPARLLSELMLGSTARYCLHHASGPVATVPAESHWVADPTVVVGVDGSPASNTALSWALDSLPTAKINVIQAIPPYREGLLAFDRHAMDRITETTQLQLGETVTAALAAAGQPDRTVSTNVVVENARYALTRIESNADLIVVGAQGSRIVARTPLLGSTSDHVVRRANCPVVVVPTTSGSPA